SRIVPPVDVAGAVRNEHIVPVVDRVGRVGPVEDAVVHAVATVADLLLPTAGGYIERGEVGGGEARGVVSTGRRVAARATALEEDHQLVRIWTRIDGDASRRAVPALRVRKGNPSPLVRLQAGDGARVVVAAARVMPAGDREKDQHNRQYR